MKGNNAQFIGTGKTNSRIAQLKGDIIRKRTRKIKITNRKAASARNEAGKKSTTKLESECKVLEKQAKKLRKIEARKIRKIKRRINQTIQKVKKNPGQRKL